MSVYGIGSVTTAQTQTTTDKGSLNVDDFLKLMTAQLQNLDPMGENSTDSSEYISQMSQFTMLEQLGNVTESLNNLSVLSQQQISFSLVGKTATVNDGENEIQGLVEKVRYRNGYAYPVINGTEYPMSMVSEIGEE
jgi:flagellar basal-body rod modification protein FlgD